MYEGFRSFGTEKSNRGDVAPVKKGRFTHHSYVVNNWQGISENRNSRAVEEQLTTSLNNGQLTTVWSWTITRGKTSTSVLTWFSQSRSCTIQRSTSRVQASTEVLPRSASFVQHDSSDMHSWESSSWKWKFIWSAVLLGNVHQWRSIKDRIKYRSQNWTLRDTLSER